MNSSKDSNSSRIKHQSTIKSVDSLSTHRSEIITSRTGISLKSSLDTNAPSETYSTIHQNLLDTLNNSTILSPLYTNIKNESYYYQQRKKLGPKKQMALIVKYSANKCEWESNIFKMKLRDTDMEIVPQRSFVGHYKTKWNAYKHCEIACKERDCNPTKNNKKITNPDKIISTHFKITVVSEKFYRMKYIDRLCLVYQELLKSTLLGANIQSNNILSLMSNKESHEKQSNQIESKIDGNMMTGLATAVPSKLKLGSIYGKQMCTLDLFRFLLPPDESPLTMIVNPMTPSQWRPDVYKPIVTERFGSTHQDLRSLEIMNAAKPKAHKSRIEKLTTVVSADYLHIKEVEQMNGNKQHTNSEAKIEEMHAIMADSIGLDASVSGVKYKKLGGIYGHFFNDLSPSIRQLVMNKYKDNKLLIRDESNTEILSFIAKQKQDAESESHALKTNLSIMRAKAVAASISGEYDKGTSNESEMLEEVNISNLKLERTVVRLQQIRRITMWRRALKKFWWSHYGAISIQRCVRGYFSRQYARLFKLLRPKAVVRIQRCFRSCQSRTFLRIWHWLVYRLTRVVLPKIKRFIRNCFLSWGYRRNKYAICIQATVRGFLGRNRCYRLIGEKYYIGKIFPAAGLLIQKIIRGFLGRCRVGKVLKEALFRYVEVPAVIRMQRIYRGRLAKFVLYRLRIELKAILLIQRNVSVFVHKKWHRIMRWEQKRKNAATLIQKTYRGTLDRQLYQYKAHIQWYNFEFIPAVILVQSSVRRYKAIQFVNDLKLKLKAARLMQLCYLNFKKRLAAYKILDELRRKRVFKSIALIQKYIRRMIAQASYRRKKLERSGKVTMAAKMIMRAWINFLIQRKYRFEIEEFRRKQYQKQILKFIENRKDAIEDIKEIRIDVGIATKTIDRIKERIKLVETFQAQAAIRSKNVKLEMQGLQVEDFERGWAEALGQEFETLSYQKQMSTEELRLLRHHMRKRQRELLELCTEWEDAEIEIDQLEVVEMETIEGLRRAEIQQVDRETTFRFNRQIRREKSHWKIESNRKYVIQRSRPRYQAIIEQSKAKRDLKYASSINYETRARQWDLEQLTTEKLLAMDARKQDIENRPKTYQEYALPLQGTYDKVVSNTLQLLRGMTLDERASRLREQFKAKEKKIKIAAKGQFSSLKEGNNPDRKLFG